MTIDEGDAEDEETREEFLQIINGQADRLQRLIDNLLVGRPLDPVVRARIVESAEGNALFLEQMLALLAEEGHATSVPPTLQALLASRVDRLPIGERGLLERAAAVGRSFSIDAVRDLTPEGERAETELLLEQLVRRGLVQPDRSAHEDLRFVHGLIRDVVYESIPKRTRAALHERCTERLDSDELVGHHLEQAHCYRSELGVESSSLAARAADVRQIGRRAARILTGTGAIPRPERPSIVIARVETPPAPSNSSSPGSREAASSLVAPQVRIGRRMNG